MALRLAHTGFSCVPVTDFPCTNPLNFVYHYQEVTCVLCLIRQLEPVLSIPGRGDIGCGMYTVDLGNRPVDFARLDEAAHIVASGMNVWPEKQADFDLQQLFCFNKLKELSPISLSVGTLGGGNHFIEVDESHEGRHYLAIHTGNRNLGKQVAEIYQRMAIELNAHDKTLEERRAHIKAMKTKGWNYDLLWN